MGFMESYNEGKADREKMTPEEKKWAGYGLLCAILIILSLPCLLILPPLGIIGLIAGIAGYWKAKKMTFQIVP